MSTTAIALSIFVAPFALYALWIAGWLVVQRINHTPVTGVAPPISDAQAWRELRAGALFLLCVAGALSLVGMFFKFL